MPATTEAGTAYIRFKGDFSEVNRQLQQLSGGYNKIGKSALGSSRDSQKAETERQKSLSTSVKRTDELHKSTKNLTQTYREQLKQMGSLGASYKDAARHMGITTSEARQLATANQHLSRTTRDVDRNNVHLTNSLIRLNAGFKFVENAISLIKWPGLIAGAGLAAQALGALSAGAIGLVGALAPLTGLLAEYPALLGALGQAAGVIALSGIKDLTQALAGNQQALQRLTPQGREFLGFLKSLKPEFTGLKAVVQKNLFAGLERGIKGAMANFPRLQVALAKTSQVMGNFAHNFGDFLGSKGFGRDFSKITSTNTQVLRNFGRGFIGLAKALTNILVAARPLTSSIGSLVAQFGQWAASATKAGRASGTLQHFFKQTMQVGEQLGRILINLGQGFYEIGKQAAPLGRSLLESFSKATDKFREFTQSATGKNQIRAYFDQALPSILELFRLVRDIGGALITLGRSPTLAPLVRQIRTELLPVLTQMLQTTATAFGPHLVALLVQVGKLFGELAGTSGPLNIWLDTLTRLTTALNWLIEHIPGIKDVVITLLGFKAVKSAFGFIGLTGGVASFTKAIWGLVAAEEAAVLAGKELGTAGALGGLLKGGKVATTVEQGAAGAAGGAAAGAERGGVLAALERLGAGPGGAVAGGGLGGLLSRGGNILKGAGKVGGRFALPVTLVVGTVEAAQGLSKAIQLKKNAQSADLNVRLKARLDQADNKHLLTDVTSLIRIPVVSQIEDSINSITDLTGLGTGNQRVKADLQQITDYMNTIQGQGKTITLQQEQQARASAAFLANQGQITKQQRHQIDVVLGAASGHAADRLQGAKLGQHFATEFLDGFKGLGPNLQKRTRELLLRVNAGLASMPTQFRASAAKSMVEWARGLVARGELPKSALKRLIADITKAFPGIPKAALKASKGVEDALRPLAHLNSIKSLRQSIQFEMKKINIAVASGKDPTNQIITSYRQMAKQVDGAFARQEISAKQHMQAINQIVNAELQQLGLGAASKNLSSGQRKQLLAHAQNPVHRQAGGVMSVGGVGSGDKVHALLEPGEVVVNREAVRRMGGPERVNRINDLIPRFKEGGVAQLRALRFPTSAPGVLDDIEAAQSSKARDVAVAVLQRLQKMAAGGASVQALKKEAERMDALRQPYLWGGGHGAFSRNGPWDCSGAVSQVIHGAGLPLAGPMVSGGFMNYGLPGLGQQGKTGIWANAGHVWMTIDGQGFSTSAENPGSGWGTVSYNSRPGFVKRHPDIAAAQAGQGPNSRKGQPLAKGAQRGGIVQRLKGGGIAGYNKIYPRGGGPAIPFNVAAAIAEQAGLPGITMAQVAIGESTLHPGSVSPDGGYGLWQMTPRVQSDSLVRQWESIGSYFNPFKNAKMAKLLGPPNHNTYHGSSHVKGWNLHYHGPLTGTGTSPASRKLKKRSRDLGLDVSQLPLKKGGQDLLLKNWRKSVSVQPDIETLAELADRAGSLGDALPGGKKQLDYLYDELGKLLVYRNALIVVHNLLVTAIDRLNEQLAKGVGKKGKKKTSTASAGLGKVRDAASSKLGEITSSLTDLQGTVVGANPFAIYPNLNPMGRYGGKIFEVQQAIKDAGGSTTQAGLSTADLRSLKELSDLGVKFDPAAFAGLFAKGGVLGAGQWGIAGENGPEAVHGPAGITPLGGNFAPVFNVRVQIGDRDITDIVDVQIEQNENQGWNQSRQGVSP